MPPHHTPSLRVVGGLDRHTHHSGEVVSLPLMHMARATRDGEMQEAIDLAEWLQRESEPVSPFLQFLEHNPLLGIVLGFVAGVLVTAGLAQVIAWVLL